MSGFWFGKLFNLKFAQRTCIAIDMGIQNGTLAIAITAGLLNNSEMAISAAVYSLFMYATAILAIFYGRNTQRIYQEKSSANHLQA